MGVCKVICKVTGTLRLNDLLQFAGGFPKSAVYELRYGPEPPAQPGRAP